MGFGIFLEFLKDHHNLILENLITHKKLSISHYVLPVSPGFQAHFT
jgi:hypothetical protein